MDATNANEPLLAAGASDREIWACYGGGGPDTTSCVFFDARGSILRIANDQQLSEQLGFISQTVEDDRRLNIREKDGALNLCTNVSEDCRPLPASIQPTPGILPTVALSADRSRALLLAFEYIGDDAHVRTWVLNYPKLDVITTQLSPRSFYADFGDWYAIWPGKFAILSAVLCCGPAGHTLLVDPSTGEWERLYGYRGSVAPLGGSTFTILDEKQVKFVDVDTGETKLGPALPGELPEDPSAVVATQVWPQGPPAPTEAKDALIAVAFPPALVHLKGHSLAGVSPIPLCNPSAAPAEN